MVTLCLDLGNTRSKAGLFLNDAFHQEVMFDPYDLESLKNILIEFKPQASVLSSVIHHDSAIELILSEHTLFHKISSLTKLPFTIPIKKRESIGTDRLALVAAAVRFCPKKNNLVIALGSCITYNFVNQYQEFLGGSISPGMDMRFKSMHHFTAKLPLIEYTDVNSLIPLIGYDTKTNLLSGVVNGMISEMDGIINKYADKYGNFNVLLTGGNSAYFAAQLKNKIFADSNFLFKGLYALSELNNCPA
ncbi:MAG: type III pantothenate kinase [Ferruginibacter sp.]